MLGFTTFLIGLTSILTPARAGGPIEPGPPAGSGPTMVLAPSDETVGPEDRLNEALSLYQRGKAPTAQAALTQFINDPSMVDEGLRQRARVYLGEVLYQQQNEEEARRVFEAVLMLDPNYAIDPFAHPPDVCGFFETVRSYIVPLGRMSALAPPTPLPSSAYMGFGVYQFQAGNPRIGTKIAIAQATAGLVSLVTFASLLEDRKYITGQGSLEALNLRRGLQWSSTAAFYGIWAWSITDSKRHWRANVGLRPPSSTEKGSDSNGMPGFHLGLTFPTY
ncbi:MAG: tetratricopeptide repeat protein [Deltaproteobacteria bacterium]|nr:tetratricopeptide repeat protein [Deltaproteobacteria bacterium]